MTYIAHLSKGVDALYNKHDKSLKTSKHHKTLITIANMAKKNILNYKLQ